MAVNQDFRDLLAELSDRDSRFLVVGAHAVMFYTTPRYTKDLDLWIDPTPENALSVYESLAAFGAPLHELEESDLETRGTVFQIGIEPNRIDLLTEIGGLAFAPCWLNSVDSVYGDIPVKVLGREDLLRAKRAAGRTQDLLDVDRLVGSTD